MNKYVFCVGCCCALDAWLSSVGEKAYAAKVYSNGQKPMGESCYWLNNLHLACLLSLRARLGWVKVEVAHLHRS